MIKEKLINIKTKRNLRKQDVKHFTASYERSKAIGVIFCLADAKKQEAVHHFVKQLKADQKEVEVLAYKKNSKAGDDQYFHNYFTPADFNFWGKAINDDLIKFCDKKFDFLFCLDEKLNLYTKYILSCSPSNSRIGHYEEESIPFFEMQFKPKNSIGTEGLVNEILFYIKKLTHHEA